MKHHVVANIDSDMGNLRSVIGALEEHQITRVRRGSTSAYIAQPLCAKPPDIPSAVIDNPADET